MLVGVENEMWRIIKLGVCSSFLYLYFLYSCRYAINIEDPSSGYTHQFANHFTWTCGIQYCTRRPDNCSWTWTDGWWCCETLGTGIPQFHGQKNHVLRIGYWKGIKLRLVLINFHSNFLLFFFWWCFFMLSFKVDFSHLFQNLNNIECGLAKNKRTALFFANSILC